METACENSLSSLIMNGNVSRRHWRSIQSFPKKYKKETKGYWTCIKNEKALEIVIFTILDTFRHQNHYYTKYDY